MTSFIGRGSRAALEKRALELQVDTRAIFKGPTVRLKKCEYTGYSTTIYSIDHAIACLDYIGQLTGTDDCLPFACSLVEGGELLAIAEDNGDFGCGDILSRALDRMKNYNVLVCVSRVTRGCFVSELVHDQKYGKVKEAADGAIDLVLQHVLSNQMNRQKVSGTISDSNTQGGGGGEGGGITRVAENKPKYSSIDDIFANTYKTESDPALKTVILDILVDHYNLLLASGTYYSPLQFSKQFKIPYKFFEAYWMSRHPKTTGMHKSDLEEFLDSRDRIKPKQVIVDQIVQMPSPDENPYFSPTPPTQAVPAGGVGNRDRVKLKK